MKRSTKFFLSCALLFSTACEKKENGAVEPRRTEEDSINVMALLNEEDPNLVNSGLDRWLEFYPDEINRIFPEVGTSVFGIASRNYFQSDSEAKARWAETMTKLLNLGANPNVLLPYEDQRRGVLHLALEQGDFGLVENLIESQGTTSSALVLSCDAPLTRAPLAASLRVPSNAIDLNLQEEASSLTPLHYAVQSPMPNEAVIEYLLLKGASPHLGDTTTNLASPYQLVASSPSLLPIFEKYSGSQIRYESRMNTFINDEIAKLPSERQTILDLAESYKEMVDKEGFQDVQDINRIIDMCDSKERMNILGYASKYILPKISNRIVLAVRSRNESVKTLMASYGAGICLPENLSIKDDATQTFRDISLKDLLKETIVTHNNAAAAPVKALNRSLWCETIKTKAVEGGCWQAESDEIIDPGLDCSAS